MPTPEKVFSIRGIKAKGNTLAPSDIKFFSFEKEELQLNERRMKLIVERAESFLDYEIKVIPLSSYRRYVIDGNRREMQSYYSPRREAALALALAEMYERKGRFTNKLIDFIWAMLEESTWLVSAHFRCAIGAEDGVPNYFGDVREHDISLYAAATGALMSLIYKYCRDILDEVSPVIAERIKYEVTKRIIKPYVNKDFPWMGYSFPNRSNWLTWITSNVLFTAAIFADDIHIRESIVQRAMNSLDSFLSAYNPDGGCDEGPDYWTAAAGALMECLDLLYDISGGKISIYDNQLIKAMGEYAVDINIFDNYVVNFSDSANKILPNSAQVRRYAEAVDSEVLRSFGRYLNKRSQEECRPELHSGYIYRSLRSIFEPDVESAETLAAKPTVYYDHIKVALMREGDVRGEGWFLAMKGGNNAENHNHNDVGTIVVYRDKTPILIEIGACQYINYNFWNRSNSWNRDSDFHSLPTFDGIMQATGKSFMSTDEVFSTKEKSYTLQLKETYPKEAGILSYVRCGEISKSGIILTDTVELDTEREIDFCFTTPTEPKIEEHGFVLNGGARLSCNIQSELSIEAHDTTAMLCRSWGNVIYRAHFKLKSKGGKFVFTIK